MLQGGIRVLTSTLPHTNAVNLSFLFGAGSRYETDDLIGASHLFEHMLFKGTNRRPTPRQISEVVEGVGGSINAFTDREVTGYWCRMPRSHYREGLDLLADMVQNSLFRDEDIDKEKQVVFEEIRAIHDMPAARASEIQDKLLWPDQPMGRDVAGTVESVAAISRDAMLEYLHTQYAASNMVIAVTGNIEHQEIVEQVESVIGGLHDGEILPMFPYVDNLQGPQVVVERRETEQAHLSIGIKGISFFDEDRHALGLFSVILGESMSSRLFEEVREKRGLAYDIHGGMSAYYDCGAIGVESGVDPKRAAEALPVIMDVVCGMRDGVTEREFTQAKELCKGRLLPAHGRRSFGGFVNWDTGTPAKRSAHGGPTGERHRRRTDRRPGPSGAAVDTVREHRDGPGGTVRKPRAVSGRAGFLACLSGGANVDA